LGLGFCGLVFVEKFASIYFVAHLSELFYKALQNGGGLAGQVVTRICHGHFNKSYICLCKNIVLQFLFAFQEYLVKAGHSKHHLQHGITPANYAGVVETENFRGRVGIVQLVVVGHVVCTV
jgi:hypothetical protein